LVKYKEYIQEEEYKRLGAYLPSQFTANELEESRAIFSRESKFLLSVADRAGFPLSNFKEVAFAGRSNVGKSSLINAITQTKGLARVSNTPGRTQMLNFFQQDNKFLLVDLPGFGYAKASKHLINSWKQLTYDYLQGRRELECVFFLIDSRHGIKTIDEDIMNILDRAAVSYQIVLTKFDKIKKNDELALLGEIKNKIIKKSAARPNFIVTSSKNNFGIDITRAVIYRIIK
tara:strand:- start:56150 stop:56842 length:693 start_codon:yes stop_codon:yes gene_type:complete